MTQARQVPARPAARLPRFGAGTVLLAVILVLAGLLYLHGAFASYMGTDEGNYAYAAWRISAGEVPYRDFYTPQMPAFLYIGGALVALFGRSFLALRLATMAATLGAGCLLYAVNRDLMGERAALIAAGLFFVEPNVYHNARLYRPEAYMLLFALAGMYTLVQARKRERLWLAGIAGMLFGLSILNKLFGALLWGGALLYLVYTGWRERRPAGAWAREALALVLPTLAVVGAATALFSWLTPRFLACVLEHHTSQGAGMPLAQRARNAYYLVKDWGLAQRPAVVLALLGAALAVPRPRGARRTLWVWQPPTVVCFAVLSRQLMPRHMTFVAPALASLAAACVAALLRLQGLGCGRRRGWRLAAQTCALALATCAAVLVVLPWMRRDLAEAALEEHDSARLAETIGTLVPEGQKVIVDYPGLNFMAGRASTYWAGGLSGGATQSGQIRGSMLIEEIERDDVAAVAVSISEHDPQIAAMVDYGEFRRYLQAHLSPVALLAFSHPILNGADLIPVYKQLLVYARTDTMPIRLGIKYGDLKAEAAHLSADSIAAGDTLAILSRWQALDRPNEDAYVSWLLLDAQGRQWAEAHGPLADPETHARTTDWRDGSRHLQSNTLALNPHMPEGEYWLALRLYDPTHPDVVPEGIDEMHTLGGLPVVARVLVQSAGPTAEVKALQVPAERGLGRVDFRQLILLGYDLSARELESGDSLEITLFWESLRPPAAECTTFIHLVDGAGQIVAQCDLPLIGGGARTSGWATGDVLADRYQVQIKPGTPAGDLHVLVGFYNPADGARLPILRDGMPTGEDHITLPETVSVH